MAQSLSLVAWLGPTRHPPRSLRRSLLVLVDLQDLRSYVSETLQSSAMESTTVIEFHGSSLGKMKSAFSPMLNMWNL